MVANAPLVKMSANLSAARTYRMEIELSKLNLPNSQSKSTRWVRETCLELGIHPFMIIRMTVPLSSNMMNLAANGYSGMLDGTCPIISNDVHSPCFDAQGFPQHLNVRMCPKTESHNCNAGIPSILKPT